MKNSRSMVTMLIAVLSLSSCATSTIKPGYEGIKVDNWGQRKGVQVDYPIETGRVVYNPISTDVYIYPTSFQNYVWTASQDEGSKMDESITFNSAQGVQITADVGAVFRVKPGMTPKFFIRYNKPMEELKDGVIRNEVRDELNREAAKMNTMAILGTGKSALLDSAKADLIRGPLGDYIEWQTLSFVHALRPAKEVKESIDRVVSAMNNAAAAVQTAAANVAVAHGDSAASVIRAKGRAEANTLLRQSLTPEVVQWEYLQRWDGHRPMVESGSSGGIIPMVNIPTKK